MFLNLDKLEETSREANKIIDLEEELLIAKEVSIRLHSELEQAQDWRANSELLNKELKKQLDELKDHLDNEVNRLKTKNSTFTLSILAVALFLLFAFFLASFFLAINLLLSYHFFLAFWPLFVLNKLNFFNKNKTFSNIQTNNMFF